MLGIVNWIWTGIKGFGQAVALPFLKIHSSSRLQTMVRWGGHVLSVAGVLTGLGYLNYALNLDTMLLTPYPILRSIWLPLLGFQLYVVSWIGWWLCHVMTSQHKVGQFPDIDQAWKKAVTALEQAAIDLTKTPLFLVIGSPAGSTADFFNAGRMVRAVSNAPSEDNAPFRVFANEEAIYFCCENTSLLGAQVALFRAAYHKSHSVESRRPGRLSNTEFFNKDVSFENQDSEVVVPGQGREITQQVGGAATAVARTTTELPTAKPVGSDALEAVESNLALLEKEQAGKAEDESGRRVYQPKRKLQIPLLQDAEAMEFTSDRLVHLCRMISKARAPYCPINGVVTLVPFKASTDQRVANHTGMLIEQDLQAISQGTMVAPPSIAVFCDIEQAEGCAELITRFPDEQRHRRLGIKFPRVPDCDREKMDTMIGSGLRWLCQNMVPPIVNRLFQTERNLNEEQPVQTINNRLFGFTSELRRRQATMERIIRRAFLGNNKRQSRLRGCYLSASGKDAISQQAFTAGIMSQVLDMQNDVQWTHDAIQRDRDFHRWIVTGYVGLGSVLAVLVFTLIF